MIESPGTKHVNNVSFADISQSNLDKPHLQFTRITDELIGEYNLIHNIGTKFFFNTNYGAPKGKIVMIDIHNYDKKNPSKSMIDVIPEHPKNVMKGASVYGHKLVVNYMENAIDKLKVYDFNVPANFLREINLPSMGSIPEHHGISGKWDKSTFEYGFTSYSNPGERYEVNLNDYSQKLIKKTEMSEVDKNYDPKNYLIDQVFYPSKDGTKIPMFIVRRKSVLGSLVQKPLKAVPTILYGYGGFGVA